MNKRQLEVQKTYVRSEKQVIKELKQSYEDSLSRIQQKIRDLQADELTQSKIYQIEYQKALEQQIDAILDMMNSNNYTTISKYLKDCYEDGFIGTMYDLQGQEIPLVLPMDQEQAAKVISTTNGQYKLSDNLYKNTKSLKKVVRSEIARGISTSSSYQDIARNLSLYSEADYNKALRIARTEGHRVQQSATHDAQNKAKAKGADVVKQWDSTLDSKTRESHKKLDGQIRELDEMFEVNGHKAKYPSDFGIAKEDVNCRCCLLQRARWALTDEEYTKYNGDTNDLIKLKEKDYKKFKKSYRNVVSNL